MNKHNQKIRKPTGLIKTLYGVLFISLPAMLVANAALAMPRMQSEKRLSQASPTPGTVNEVPPSSPGTSTTPLNPSPSIFNEAPYNRQQRTSPNDLNVAPTTPDNQQLPSTSPTMQPAPGGEVQPPLPESQQPPSAMVTLAEGKLNIKLINTTNAVINYQVIGDTNQRVLNGDADVTLQNIKSPVTVTFSRADKGLLKVTTQASSAGLLEVMLDETTNLDEDKSTVVVQPSGAVYVN